MIASVESGSRRSFVIMIVSVEPGRWGPLSLGIVILTVEPGGRGSFVCMHNDYIEKEPGREWRVICL